MRKKILFKALKFLALSMPFMLAGPILITIGFKAIAKDGIYYIFIIGLVVALLAILLMTLGIKTLLNSIFYK